MHTSGGNSGTSLEFCLPHWAIKKAKTLFVRDWDGVMGGYFSPNTNSLTPAGYNVMCQQLSHVRLFLTPQTVACQVLLSMEFSRQEYWSGLPFSSPRDLYNPGIELGSPALQADSLLSESLGRANIRGKEMILSLIVNRVCVCLCSYTQLCLTLCDPVDCSPPGFSVHGILQARILEWAAIYSSRRPS